MNHLNFSEPETSLHLTSREKCCQTGVPNLVSLKHFNIAEIANCELFAGLFNIGGSGVKIMIAFQTG